MAFQLAAFVGLIVLVFVLNHLRKVLSRGKYHATSRISWKGAMFNLALWPESILKRKPAFQTLTLAALKKSAIKGAKGLNDFGFVITIMNYAFILLYISSLNELNAPPPLSFPCQKQM